MKKSIKIIKSLISIICIFVMTFSLVNVFAGSNEEKLLINNSEVKYYKSSEVITIPTEYEYNLFEMRGMWVSTVWNEDFSRCYTVNSFKSQFTKVLDNLQSNNFNTILFQIRPSNDAFYVSTLNPWSEWMTGTQGKALTNIDGTVFDPLDYMITETHKRDMKFMGWLNAYRVSARTLYSSSSNDYSETEVKAKVTEAIGKLSDDNWAKKNSRYVLLGDIDSKLILNPGEPSVRSFLVRSIEEIVTNYDIDGVHFDDYFYLDSSNSNAAERIVNTPAEYKSADTAFNDYYNDYNTYMQYRLQNETLADFRRRSVNLMIKGISEAVQSVNQKLGKTVEFGSKPAAVWTSSARDVSGRIEGANVLAYSYSSYFDIFADSLYWAEQGWVDWIAPQIYFNFTNQEVPYADIVKWWAGAIEQSNNNLIQNGKEPVDLYIAHGFYRLSNSEKGEKQITDPMEMNKQLLFNQKFPTIKGSAFYNYGTFSSSEVNVKSTKENLLNIWNKKTLPEINSGECKLYIDNVTINKELKTLTITPTSEAIYYIVYKCESPQECIDSNIVAVIGQGDLHELNDIDINSKYYVRGVNKDYQLSSNYYEVSDNIKYEVFNMYVGDEYTIDSSTFISLDNEEMLSYKDGVLIALHEGVSQVVVMKDNIKTVYVCKAVNPKFYNVTIINGDGYTLTMDGVSPIREGSSVTFTLTLDPEYNKSSARIGINSSFAPFREETYTYNNIQKDIEVKIVDIEINTYVITLDILGELTIQNVVHGDDVVFPEINNIPNKTFIGWDSDGLNIQNDATIKALFKTDNCIVSFDTNGGNAIDNVTVKYDSSINEIIPFKDGYVFLGWYIDSELLEKFENSNTIITDLTLYASWRKLFKIIYDANGGSCDDLTTEFEDASDVVLPTPTRDGYTFNGWYDNGDLITTVENKDYVLIANWEENTGCKSLISLINYIFTIPFVIGIIVLRKKY